MIAAQSYSKAAGSKGRGFVARSCPVEEVRAISPKLGTVVINTYALTDWEIINNHDDIQTAHLDTRYNLVTHDGASIYLQTTGTRTGPREVLEKLGKDTSIKANQFAMRLHLTMETGDPRYSWVNDGVFVASSGRSGDQVIYDAYQLL